MCKRCMRSIDNQTFGIGLRSEHIEQLRKEPVRPDIDFLELAPDNWMAIGGAKRAALDEIADKYPLVAHGLSLSIGDPWPLNETYLRDISNFLTTYSITIYSDHLCMSRDEQGYLYDLLPIPRTKKIITYLADRINQVQQILQRPLVLENISAYYRYPDDMPELDFWLSVLDKTSCEMLLDINNVYVNSCNDSYDPHTFITSLPGERIRYYHIAGHLKTHDILLDTHGRPIEKEVLALARTTWRHHGARPMLLERDHHIPRLDELCTELDQIKEAVTTRRVYHAP